MRTFERLEAACRLRGIVCERAGRKINLITPDGSVNAECGSFREAVETFETDETFSSLPLLPIKLVQARPAYKAELYKYELFDRNNVLESCKAESLGEAMERFSLLGRVKSEFLMFAVVQDDRGREFAVKWSKI